MGRASREKAQRSRPVLKARSRAAPHWAILLLLAVVALAIFSKTFSAPFQFDDENNIVDNPWVHSLTHLLDFSGTRYVGFLTFALNYWAGGLHVFGYHLVNLLIHIANGFLVYSLVRLLLRAVPGAQPAASPWIALTTALLFIVHPVQTQAVTYIVQRFASLVTLFYLLAVVGYLKWRLSPSAVKARSLWYAASLLSCLLAMKTKENSFTLPFMILLIEMIFFWPITRRGWLALLPFLLMLSIIPLSQGNILGETERFARDTDAIGRLDYLFTQFRVIVTYLRLLILPVNQSLDYAYPLYRSFWIPPVFTSFLGLSFILGLAAYFLWRGRGKLISFGILWFFLAHAVESSIIPIKDVIFEHRVYLPSVGFFLAVSLVGAGAWHRYARMRVPIVVLVLLAVGGLATTSYRRNLVWRDRVGLWKDVVEKFPQNPRGHYNLGLAYQEKGGFEEATRAYRTVASLKPDYADAYNNLGNIYKDAGRLEEAGKEYQQALKVDPDHAKAHNNLGVIYTVQGRPEEGIRLFERAIELKPSYAEAYNNLGLAHTAQGRLDQAIQVYRRGLQIQGDLDKMHFNLGNTLVRQGRLEEGIDEYRQVLSLKPDHPEATRNLDNAVKQLNGINGAN